MHKVVVVVGHCCAHYFESVNTSIHVDNTGLRLLSGHELVSQEVVLKSFHQHGRDVADVASSTPDVVVFQNADDLVVRFSVVDHLQAADNPASDDDLVSRDRSFAEDTDIQRVTIAPFSSRRQPANTLITIGARNKPIE